MTTGTTPHMLVTPPTSVTSDDIPHRYARALLAPRHEAAPARSRSMWSRVVKRCFDIALALLLLLATVPVLLVIALAIKLDSPGPIFFRARRVGHRGRPLLMTKFRKMHHDAAGGPLTTLCDPRLTRVGAVLARTKLDELPQLWDVVRGEMSIVGPRPEDTRFVELHRDAYDQILFVRPGMTGVCQLAFANESSILDQADPVGDYVARILPQKIALDTRYASRARIGTDLAVLGWTITAVLVRRPVAVHRETGRISLRKRTRRPVAVVQTTGAVQTSAEKVA